MIFTYLNNQKLMRFQTKCKKSEKDITAGKCNKPLD